MEDTYFQIKGKLENVVKIIFVVKQEYKLTNKQLFTLANFRLESFADFLNKIIHFADALLFRIAVVWSPALVQILDSD